MPADMPMRDNFLKKASGFEFYNTSKYDFERLLSDPDNIESNFNNYINGFSDNVIDMPFDTKYGKTSET